MIELLKHINKITKSIDEQSIEIQLGKKKMIIKNRYQVIYYINNIIQGLFYLVGSILSLNGFNQTIAISFFLAGSILMVFRSFIQIVRDIHLMKLDEGKNNKLGETVKK